MNKDTLIQSIHALVQQFQSLESSLPAAQREVLMILAHHKALNLSQLAELRGVRKSSMSVMITQLIELQWVIRGLSKSDRRQKLYMLSRAGREILDREFRLYHQWLDKILTPLNSDEQQVLTKFLRQFQPMKS